MTDALLLSLPYFDRRFHVHKEMQSGIGYKKMRIGNLNKKLKLYPICDLLYAASVLKKQKITLCRIPSSKVSKASGCDDLIKELCRINPEFEDASQSIKRTQNIIPAHLGGQRDEELHKKTSLISDLELFNNKDVLLIDDIITTGKSARAYSELIKEKTNPKSLNLLIFGKTTDDNIRH